MYLEVGFRRTHLNSEISLFSGGRGNVNGGWTGLIQEDNCRMTILLFSFSFQGLFHVKDFMYVHKAENCISLFPVANTD